MTSLGLSYSYDTRDYRDQNGDSRAGVGSLFYGETSSRRSRLRFSYGYADSQLLEPDRVGFRCRRTRPTEGWSSSARSRATRRLVVSFGGGAIRAFTRERLTRESVNVWVPAGYGTMRLDWARTWGMSADYRRSVGALQGISGDAFTTDAGLVRLEDSSPGPSN